MTKRILSVLLVMAVLVLAVTPIFAKQMINDVIVRDYEEWEEVSRDGEKWDYAGAQFTFWKEIQFKHGYAIDYTEITYSEAHFDPDYLIWRRVATRTYFYRTW